MTATLPAPTTTTLTLRPGRCAGRCAVALILVCVGVHLVGAVQHWAMSPLLSAATITVAAGCLHCVRCLCVHPTIRGWLYAATGFGLMLALHMIMILDVTTPMAGASGGHHQEMAMSTTTGTAAGLGVLAYTGIVIPILGIAVAWWALGHTQPAVAENDHSSNV